MQELLLFFWCQFAHIVLALEKAKCLIAILGRIFYDANATNLNI